MIIWNRTGRRRPPVPLYRCDCWRESPEQECFGYDRLEAVLSDYITLTWIITRYIAGTLFVPCWKPGFGDDVTFFQIEFYQRQLKNTAVDWAPDLDVVYIVHSLYRVNRKSLRLYIQRAYCLYRRAYFSELLPSLPFRASGACCSIIIISAATGLGQSFTSA